MTAITWSPDFQDSGLPWDPNQAGKCGRASLASTALDLQESGATTQGCGLFSRAAASELDEPVDQTWSRNVPSRPGPSCFSAFQALPALCLLPVRGFAEDGSLPELQLCCHLAGLDSASPLRVVVSPGQRTRGYHPRGSLSGDTAPGLSAPSSTWTHPWDVKLEISWSPWRLLCPGAESPSPDPGAVDLVLQALDLDGSAFKPVVPLSYPVMQESLF
ncbi:uncharacterized protein LOC125114799 isoform X3 [Phacochoerus africanus]|uniref:uncharacterized protein LOC125114799 isoform X3 n=1 Tax=Phacochoerus africanus TaxID=41426 RepID=UPI001FD8EAD2|nr:uncharacterized protein LOC125114799 isoform X3 [Phacochoerus africanus]